LCGEIAAGIFSAMRLEKIKLAGFKSFVDPTTVLFPSNLVGVVGPNGCGKSNVIDAVRWVMGESSAKMLRGESMADVIFNGSSGRKPVGTAGIELVFDNSDGSAGGELARFNQIAVKRQVSRDGQSAYFMNGARCRRRDIQDLFLGTGLGPRSYAIIEQGMISRFIEARPEDLRLFIEEAAGISKYKERRRETENRMRHTRENLARLDDLRDEVAKQLHHLERQAATAAKYRALKEDERRLEDELAALQWRALDRDIEQRDRRLGEAEVAAEADRAELRRLEADIEAQRAAHAEASDAFNAVQGRYYAAGAEIARLEQGLKFAAETRARQESELGRIRRELDEAGDLQGRDEQRLAEIDADLARDEPLLAETQDRLQQVRARLRQAEQRLDEWQAAWDAIQARSAEPTALAQRERGSINILEQRIAQDDQRLARIEDELGRLDTAELERRLEQLDERSDGLDERIRLAADTQSRAGETLRRADEERHGLEGQLDAARTELQTSRGRQSSLEALQDAALETDDEAVARWIDAQGLADVPRLLDLLDVEPGWERAVEIVLGETLGGLCVDDLDRLAARLETGALTLIDGTAQGVPGGAADDLRARVKGPPALTDLLAGVGLADSLAEALSRRADLAPGQRIIIRDGALVGRSWVNMPASGPEVAGSIARAEELKALQSGTDELEDVIAELVAKQDALAARRQQLEGEREEAHESLSRLSRERANLDAELGAGRSRLQHMRERRASLSNERQELSEARAEAVDGIEDARERLHEALESSETLAAERDALAAERDGRREAVTEVRGQEGALRDQVQQLEVAIQTRRASREAILSTLDRAGERLADLAERRDELADSLEESAEPAEEQQARLEEQLALRLAVEQELNETRGRMDTIDSAVREAEQQRHRIEQRLAEAQRGLDAERLQRQERLVRRRTLEEQLAARDADPRRLLDGLDPAADDDGAVERWRAELEQVGARIARLGNINLAAIDEFQEQSERMRYLDDQHGDISRSLETLESAIRKIDRETRARFKETFDQINAGLQQLFPRVFGGGNAYLELTGEDLLETGVAIMARPPGKRNSSIHMLSGGEKALTAVALVFAIFQLNPAPFCMLDEVDAPLDDANVGRFCELVRSMSDQIQFIFITHNKVTMEIAEHLLGVTMHEPGVSRLVSVDVDEAARMVAVG
jgi:chromosome segregation protein